MANTYKLIHPLKHFRDHIENGVRLDGRGFDECRPVLLNIGCFGNALGSSAVKVGNTNIVCGIRPELAKPKAATPQRGYLIPRIDATFLTQTSTSPEVMSTMIYNILLDSECINLEELCVHKQKLVWALHLDIICLEMDGAGLDAMLFACVAALTDLKLPNLTYDEQMHKIEKAEGFRKLNINSFPVLSTHCKFEDTLLVDPTQDEEKISNGMFHIGISNDSVGMLHKSGGLKISKPKLESTYTTASRRAKEFAALFESVKSNPK